MYNSLTGRITGRGLSTLCITTGGVEWELEVSGFTHRELASVEQARVFTHLHHREDQMRLYGFATEDERRVFLELTRVSGIGPRVALRMLSATSPSALVRLLESEDVDGLTLLPGLGRKTAQKVILALRGRLVSAEHEASPAHAELVEGLVEMGFDRQRVVAVVGLLAGEVGEEFADHAEFEREIFRRAIVQLSE